jgi:CBS domain containing-hemolysin-like protein
MNISPLLFSALFFVGTIALGALRQSLLRLKKRDMKKALRLSGNLFFYKSFSSKIFGHDEASSLSFASIVTLNTCRFFTVFFLALWYEEQGFRHTPFLIQALGFGVILSLLYLTGDYLPKLFANKHPSRALYIFAPLASPFLLATLPLIYTSKVPAAHTWSS